MAEKPSIKSPLIKTSNEKLEEIKVNIEIIKDTMHQNIDKIIERGENLEALEDKAEQLKYDANMFNKKAKKLRYKICIQNIKKNAVIILIISCIIGVIIYLIYSAAK
jgi:hypothetical protein